MNRYFIDGVLRDMRAGRRVLVLAPTYAATTDAFEAVAVRRAHGEGMRRVNGDLRIRNTAAGGEVLFQMDGAPALRGMEADVIVALDRPATLEAVQLHAMLVACSSAPEAERMVAGA